MGLLIQIYENETFTPAATNIKGKDLFLPEVSYCSISMKDKYRLDNRHVDHEHDTDYIKILGRRSEIINVGGEKVYPQEVENVIQEIDNVSDVTVYGEKNNILGNIVCATVRMLNNK